MPLLTEEAAKLSQEDIQRGIIEEIIDQDELFALFPFMEAKDLTFTYTREKTLAEGEWFGAYDDLEESTSEVENISVQLKRLAGQVDIDNFAIEVQSNFNSQLGTQIAMKSKGMGRQFRRAMIQGNSSVNPLEIDGLPRLITAAQTQLVGTNGAALTFSMLDELKDMVKRGADVLMMRPGTWRAIRALNRTMGGNTADHIMLPNFGRPIPAYDGTPVIINEWIPANEVAGSSSVTTSIYGLRLNEVDGLHGIFGGPAAGFRLQKVGLLQGKDVTRYRILWYVALAQRSTLSAARLRGVTNI